MTTSGRPVEDEAAPARAAAQVAVLASAALLVLTPAALPAQGFQALPWSSADTASALPGDRLSGTLAESLEEIRVVADFAVDDLNADLDTFPADGGPGPQLAGRRVDVAADSVARVRMAVSGFPPVGSGERPRLCEVARGLATLLEIGGLNSRAHEGLRGFALAVYAADDGAGQGQGGAESPADGAGGTIGEPLARTAEGRVVACGGRELALPPWERVRAQTSGPNSPDG